MTRLAILAGQGGLPVKIANERSDALFVHFDGLKVALPGNEAMRASFERFGELFDGLTANGVTEVVFAGGLARPPLNPANFDAKMAELAPRFLAAMKGGDDELLRSVVVAFEAHGFTVRGAHELVEGLTAAPGLLVGPQPSEADLQDIAKARAILAALGSLDIGQGAVVCGGQPLGIETAQGTDAMLQFVAGTGGAQSEPKGVLVKAPKPGQDLRIDMPAIGPDTITAAASAGLAGIAFDAEQVLLIDRDAMVNLARDEGLFLLAQAP